MGYYLSIFTFYYIECNHYKYIGNIVICRPIIIYPRMAYFSDHGSFVPACGPGFKVSRLLHY